MSSTLWAWLGAASGARGFTIVPGDETEDVRGRQPVNAVDSARTSATPQPTQTIRKSLATIPSLSERDAESNVQFSVLFAMGSEGIR